MQKTLLRLLAISVACAGISACGEVEKEVTPAGWDTSEQFDEPTPEPDDDERPEPDDDEPDPDPPDPDDVEPTGAADGAACDADDECLGGACLTGDAWPDGYCTHGGCDGSCDSANSGCVDGPLGNFCAEYCSNDGDCREGYACDSQPGSPGRVCVPASGKPDGEPCAADNECQGGTCITDWPGGYCTTLECENFEDCSRQGFDNKCLRVRGPDLCVRICTENSECREDYVCQMFGDGSGMCAPDPAQPLSPASLADTPFDLTCQAVSGDSVSIDYTVAPDTLAYMITPLTKDGRRIAPNRVDLPSGANVDMQGSNWFQSIPAELYGGMNPTIVPATKQFEGQLEPGAHSYELFTESSEVCHYILEESTAGDTIDFNVYFVDVPGLDSSNAAQDPDFQEVLAQFDEIYASSGVQLGKVRYFDITGDAAQEYGVLRSDTAVSELVTLSGRPGPTMDDVLSVNIFFVRAFALGGAIGISLGLPGPAGLHGTHGSGVAFTAEYLGEEVQPSFGNEMVDGNVFTGQILAHEVGHYIGLFHTSESNGFSHDPLPDTPECSRISQQCPDIDNLMFPFAGESHVEISADQQYVIQVNPLTKDVAQPADPQMGGDE